MCLDFSLVFPVGSSPSRVGNDDKVTIVDFCKMVANPEPADLALEMRAVKFTLNYDGAKKIEYGRLRRAESRIEKNLWRSRLRRTAESQELAEEVEPDEPPSQDEIAVSFSLPCSPCPFTYFKKPVSSVQRSMPREVGLRIRYRRYNPLFRVEREAFRSPRRYAKPAVARSRRLYPAHTATLQTR